MLASRLGAVAVGETRYLWERGFERGELCSCGAPVPECQFWTAILDETRSDDLPAPDAIAALQNYLNRNRRLPEMVVQPMRSRALREHLTNFARVSASLYRAIVEVSGRGIVVDSSKHPAYASALVDVPDVRVVGHMCACATRTSSPTHTRRWTASPRCASMPVGPRRRRRSFTASRVTPCGSPVRRPTSSRTSRGVSRCRRPDVRR